MKNSVVVFCLSLFFSIKVFSYDEFLGLSGTKLSTGQDFDIVQNQKFNDIMREIETFENKLTQEEIEITRRYFNIAVSRAVFHSGFEFNSTPISGEELYYIVKGRDLLKSKVDEILIDLLKSAVIKLQDLMLKLKNLFSENSFIRSRL